MGFSVYAVLVRTLNNIPRGYIMRLAQEQKGGVLYRQKIFIV